MQWLLQKGHRVIAVDKSYGDDPRWSSLESEQEARKVVEDDASFLFPALANRFGFEPDLILARSLGTYSLGCALEKKLIRPKKIVWQTPALRTKWNTIHDCDIPGFAVIGTGDPRYAESLSYLSRYAEAQNTIEQLIRSTPTAAAHERLATALFRQKKYDEAVAAFRKSLELDAAYYPSLNGVGVCLLNRWLLTDKQDMEIKEEAVRSLRRSLQIEQKQPMVMDLITRYGSQ